jgi:outer membrane immunogenic protein
MRWDASVRARVGYLISPDLLAYAAGGIAWQSVQVSATCQHSLPDPLCAVMADTPFATATNNSILTGWTIGAGLEYRIYGNWLLRGEYRYSDFGTRTGEVLNLGLPGGAPTILTHDLKVNTHVATGGLGFKF